MKKQKLLTLLAIMMAVILAVGTANADLIGFWNFDDGNAGTGPGGIKDLATEGGSHDGTLTGGAFSTDVPSVLAGGRSLDLTTGTSYVNIDTFLGGASDNDFNTGTALSVSVWVKGWPDSWESFVSKNGEGGEGWQIRRRSNANDPTLTLRGTTAADDPASSLAVGPNTGWTHLAATYDGALRKLYVNGVETMSIADTGTIGTTASLVSFGARYNAASIANVMLDDIGIWNNALTAQEVQDLADGISPVKTAGADIIYPKYGEVVPPGDVVLEWINYDDPCSPGASVYVDVWFGTEISDDPNVPGDYTKVLVGAENATSLTITPPGPGIYYWQVDNIIGINDPCTFEGRVYMFTNDGPIELVDAGADMVTWDSEPVLLDPNIIDDGGSELTYSWTISTPNGLTAVIDPGSDIANPTVTFAKYPYDKPGIANASFEDPVWPDDGGGQIVPSGWTVVGGNSGSLNPGADQYAGIAPDGDNLLWLNKNTSASQLLNETVQEGATYTLSVDIGYDARWGGTGSHTNQTSAYVIQLLAGSGEDEVVLAEDSAFMDDFDNYYSSVVTYTNDPDADADLIGKRLQIRLTCPPEAQWNAYYDNVVLTSDQIFNPPMLPAELTLTVQDATNPAVSDTMTIEVYSNECMAARMGLGLDLDTDYDKNCQIILSDLAVLAANWLIDTSATDFARAEPGPSIAGQLGILDVTGTNPATGQPWAAGDQYRLAFVTGVTRDATDPSIATYNAFVQAAADAAGLGGTWKCVAATYDNMSAGNYDANRDANVGRLTEELPTYLVDGTTKLWDQFLSGNPLTKYNMTETGGIYEGNVATGAGRVLGDPGQTNIENGNSSRTDAAWWRVFNHSQTSQSHFYAVSEPLTVIVPVVDAGDKISTWIGQPFTMAPIVGDPNDPSAVFDYEWTSSVSDILGLSIDISDPAIEAPTVTINREYVWRNVTVINPSFEERENFDAFPEATDKYFQWALESWRQFEVDNNGGPMRIWNPGVLGVDETPQGLFDVAFGGNAPDGKYVGVAYTRYNDNEMPEIRPVRDWEAIVQLVDDPKFVFNPDANYQLTVQVGRLPEGPDEGGSINFNWDTSDPNFPDGKPSIGWNGYAVQLVAGGTNVDGSMYAGHVVGGTVIAEDYNSLTVAPNGFVTVTVDYVPGSASADLAGLPLQIRLCALENPEDHSTTSYAAFDDVSLITDAPVILSLEDINMTLSVTKQGEPNSVSDSVTIDVYDNPCEMVNVIAPETIDITDHNLDCITNLADFATLAADWLLDYALTAPAIKP